MLPLQLPSLGGKPPSWPTAASRQTIRTQTSLPFEPSNPSKLVKVFPKDVGPVLLYGNRKSQAAQRKKPRALGDIPTTRNSTTPPQTLTYQTKTLLIPNPPLKPRSSRTPRSALGSPEPKQPIKLGFYRSKKGRASRSSLQTGPNTKFYHVSKRTLNSAQFPIPLKQRSTRRWRACEFASLLPKLSSAKSARRKRTQETWSWNSVTKKKLGWGAQQKSALLSSFKEERIYSWTLASGKEESMREFASGGAEVDREGVQNLCVTAIVEFQANLRKMLDDLAASVKKQQDVIMGGVTEAVEERKRARAAKAEKPPQPDAEVEVYELGRAPLIDDDEPLGNGTKHFALDTARRPPRNPTPPPTPRPLTPRRLRPPRGVRRNRKEDPRQQGSNDRRSKQHPRKN